MCLANRTKGATEASLTPSLRNGHHHAVLTHIVLWSFRDTVPSEERVSLIEAIRALRTQVPSLRSLEVGENRTPARAQGYTHILLETFEDQAGLAAYSSHSAHLPVATRIRDAAAQLLAVDLEG